MVNNSPFISVVIPVYNEQARIAQTLFEVKDYLSRKAYNSEIIIVDDGSEDTTTEVIKVVDIYQSEFKQQPSCVILRNITNTGKGFSVARGCEIASGKFVLFMDADSSTPIHQATPLLTAVLNGYDIAIGVRSNQSVRYKPIQRRLGSLVFRLLSLLLGLSALRDTQCGFKLYRQGAIAAIIQHQTVWRWCFDVEHLYIARKLGYRITSVEVDWTHQDGSKIHMIRDFFRTVADLIRIRRTHGAIQRPRSTGRY